MDATPTLVFFGPFLWRYYEERLHERRQPFEPEPRRLEFGHAEVVGMNILRVASNAPREGRSRLLDGDTRDIGLPERLSEVQSGLHLFLLTLAPAIP